MVSAKMGTVSPPKGSSSEDFVDLSKCPYFECSVLGSVESILSSITSFSSTPSLGKSESSSSSHDLDGGSVLFSNKVSLHGQVIRFTFSPDPEPKPLSNINSFSTDVSGIKVLTSNLPLTLEAKESKPKGVATSLARRSNVTEETRYGEDVRDTPESSSMDGIVSFGTRRVSGLEGNGSIERKSSDPSTLVKPKNKVFFY